jgi:hypothetical protein
MDEFPPEISEALGWKFGDILTAEKVNEVLQQLGSDLRVVAGDRTERGLAEIVRLWKQRIL